MPQELEIGHVTLCVELSPQGTSRSRGEEIPVTRNVQEAQATTSEGPTEGASRNEKTCLIVFIKVETKLSKSPLLYPLTQ